MSFVAVAIGAGAGLVKSEAIDRPKEARERKLAAETQRNSPWTGLQAQPIHEADPMGNAVNFGTMGMQGMQNYQNEMAQQKLRAAQTGWIDRGGDPKHLADLNAASAPSFGYGAMGPRQQSPWSYAGYDPTYGQF